MCHVFQVSHFLDLYNSNFRCKVEGDVCVLEFWMPERGCKAAVSIHSCDHLCEYIMNDIECMYK